VATPEGFVFFYGDYDHPAGEVYPKRIETKPMLSKQNIRYATMWRFEVGGNFVNNSPNELTYSDISQRISTMDTAYRTDYKNCGFRDPSSALTPHWMNTNSIDNLSGNRILSRSWDGIHPTEYANTRSFSVAIGAVFKDSYSSILEFSESVKKIGDGGPKFTLHNLWNRNPYKHVTHAYSKVIHIQSGTIVGLNTWPTPPAPYWPQEEQTWKRSITQHAPRTHGHPYQRVTHFRVDYQYIFERPSAGAFPLNPWSNI